MNKKAAIATAGGLVAALLAGALALSLNMGINTPSAATASPQPVKREGGEGESGDD